MLRKNAFGHVACLCAANQQAYEGGEDGGEDGGGEMYGESNIEIYNTICKIDNQWEFAE